MSGVVLVMNDFLQLIDASPGLKLLEVTSNDFLTQALYEEVCKSEGSEYLQSRYEGEYLQRDASEQFVVHDIASFDKPFKGKNREYEYVILNDIISKHTYRDRIVKLAYSSLENSAFIIIVEPKENMSEENIIALLDTFEFRAVGAIDIFKDKHVVMGKKMHMWGNGQ